jgi:hypothetical protein
MAIRIKAPANSFVQFLEADTIDSCQFSPIVLCLPVFADNDVSFQFILETDTEDEADNLCDLSNSLLTVGIAESCDEEMLIEFPYKAERYRIGTRSVLYNWQNGLPGFATVISKGQCFIIKITLQLPYVVYDYCSNCFQRIADVCHTSVLEYGNEDNAFGFDYCGGTNIDTDNPQDCDPLIISFTNRATIAIPYTTELQLKYGSAPTVQVWIYDGDELVDMGIRVSFDSFPPTLIGADFGGLSSGIIKIS